MLNYLAHNWLNRRMARRIPNPYMRAAAVAGIGMLVTGLARKGMTRARRTR